MQRYFFSLRIAAVVILAAILVSSLDLWLHGFAVVHDPDEVMVAATLAGGGERQPMRRFATGYWAARPWAEGAIVIRCRAGAERLLPGSDVAPGRRTAVTVRAADCAGGRKHR